MTQAVPTNNAVQCYQTGIVLYERKRFLDALVMLKHACKLAPNSMEYRAAYEQIQTLAMSLGGWFSKKPMDPNLNRSDFCSETCCECCGECCANGCAECCGELCSNCDCDCS